MRHRGKTSSRLSVRTGKDLFGWNNLKFGKCSPATWPRAWFRRAGSAAMPPPVNRCTPRPRRSRPAIRRSPSATQAGNNASGQLDWIVQFNTAAASGIAGAAGAARLLPPGGAQFQILEGLGAVGEVLVRSYGATAAQATAALQSDRQIAWFEADSLKQIDAAVPNDAQFSQQWALDNTGQNGGTAGDDIDATQAWNITTGSRNVVVAVIDSGVDYTDPDLAANIWTNPNAGQDGFSGDLHGYNFVEQHRRSHGRQRPRDLRGRRNRGGGQQRRGRDGRELERHDHAAEVPRRQRRRLHFRRHPRDQLCRHGADRVRRERAGDQRQLDAAARATPA